MGARLVLPRDETEDFYFPERRRFRLAPPGQIRRSIPQSYSVSTEGSVPGGSFACFSFAAVTQAIASIWMLALALWRRMLLCPEEDHSEEESNNDEKSHVESQYDVDVGSLATEVSAEARISHRLVAWKRRIFLWHWIGQQIDPSTDHQHQQEVEEEEEEVISIDSLSQGTVTSSLDADAAERSSMSRIWLHLTVFPRQLSHSSKHVSYVVLASVLLPLVFYGWILLLPLPNASDGLSSKQFFLYGNQSFVELSLLAPFLGLFSFAMPTADVSRKARACSILASILVAKLVDAILVNGWVWKPVFPFPFSPLVSSALALFPGIAVLYLMMPSPLTPDTKTSFRLCCWLVASLVLCVVAVLGWVFAVGKFMGLHWVVQTVWAVVSFPVIKFVFRMSLIGPLAKRLNPRKIVPILAVVDGIFVRMRLNALPYIENPIGIAGALLAPFVALLWKYFGGPDRLSLVAKRLVSGRDAAARVDQELGLNYGADHERFRILRFLGFFSKIARASVKEIHCVHMIDDKDEFVCDDENMLVWNDSLRSGLTLEADSFDIDSPPQSRSSSLNSTNGVSERKNVNVSKAERVSQDDLASTVGTVTDVNPEEGTKLENTNADDMCANETEVDKERNILALSNVSTEQPGKQSASAKNPQKKLRVHETDAQVDWRQRHAFLVVDSTTTEVVTILNSVHHFFSIMVHRNYHMDMSLNSNFDVDEKRMMKAAVVTIGMICVSVCSIWLLPKIIRRSLAENESTMSEAELGGALETWDEELEAVMSDSESVSERRKADVEEGSVGTELCSEAPSVVFNAITEASDCKDDLDMGAVSTVCVADDSSVADMEGLAEFDEKASLDGDECATLASAKAAECEADETTTLQQFQGSERKETLNRVLTYLFRNHFWFFIAWLSMMGALGLSAVNSSYGADLTFGFGWVNCSDGVVEWPDCVNGTDAFTVGSP